MRRIGIDVGGTHTDAVLIAQECIVASVKTPTTADVTSGIIPALTLSSLEPSKVLKQLSGIKLFSKLGLRKALIISQFTLLKLSTMI